MFSECLNGKGKDLLRLSEYLNYPAQLENTFQEYCSRRGELFPDACEWKQRYVFLDNSQVQLDQATLKQREYLGGAALFYSNPIWSGVMHTPLPIAATCTQAMISLKKFTLKLKTRLPQIYAC